MHKKLGIVIVGGVSGHAILQGFEENSAERVFLLEVERLARKLWASEKRPEIKPNAAYKLTIEMHEGTVI